MIVTVAPSTATPSPEGVAPVPVSAMSTASAADHSSSLTVVVSALAASTSSTETPSVVAAAVAPVVAGVLDVEASGLSAGDWAVQPAVSEATTARVAREVIRRRRMGGPLRCVV
ncbi:hypothetical protein [Tessaracoccus defluvii]|uniref:Uncharacterized protein n=1 Tax=Tessaracoccus defluvii TaxID=1285901 RepID=A0A7H0H7W9_9ACTN|nr:hypothetical protein [Tessaracoccus defluvii]QNP56635.1 hypothetical protein H9L22_04310 [Tessaracoccus defluvii]